MIKKQILLIFALALSPAAHAMQREPEQLEAAEAMLGLQPMELEGPEEGAQVLAEQRRKIVIKAARKAKMKEAAQRYLQWAKAQNPQKVIFQSNDGKLFSISLHRAELSETLKNMIADAGTQKPIQVPIDSEIMRIIFTLLEGLELMKWRSENEQLFYAPSEFTDIVNDILFKAIPKDAPKEIKRKYLSEILLAAKYLQLSFVVNSLSHIIAGSVPKEARLPIMKLLLVPYNQRNNAIARLQKNNFGFIANLSHDLWRYIARHLMHYVCGANTEYSVADYVKDYGQPPLVTAYGRPNSIDLSNKKLTSLYGLEVIQNLRSAKALWLNGNCFFEPALNPQIRAVVPEIYFEVPKFENE